MLSESPIFQILGLLSLAPVIWMAAKGRLHGSSFLAAGGFAALVPVLYCGLVLQEGWRPGFSLTIWVSGSAVLVLYLGLSLVWQAVRPVCLLLHPYIGVSFLVSILVGQGEAPYGSDIGTWLLVHILIAVATYAMITMAAVMGLGVFLKERALKKRDFNPLVQKLPPVAEAERIQGILLLASEGVLALGLATGVAVQIQSGLPLLALDHKTLLTLIAFVLIGGLLAVQQFLGFRGKRAAQFVLIAYLLVTLAFPGVKFITDTLVG